MIMKFIRRQFLESFSQKLRANLKEYDRCVRTGRCYAMLGFEGIYLWLYGLSISVVVFAFAVEVTVKRLCFLRLFFRFWRFLTWHMAVKRCNYAVCKVKKTFSLFATFMK